MSHSELDSAENGTIDVLILCGGLGKRLRDAAGNRPKAMATIGGQPFLDLLVDYAAGFGFRRFILCTGYRGNVITSYYKNGKGSLSVQISEEEEPLGTGGAVKNAEYLVHSDPFLVMNGDSFCAVDFNGFIDFHKCREAMISIVLSRAEETQDYGTITLGSSHRIVSFDEKMISEEPGYVSAGIYLFTKGVFSMISDKENVSLEYDFFPKSVERNFFGYVSEENFIDIGTPEQYEEAKNLLARR